MRFLLRLLVSFPATLWSHDPWSIRTFNATDVVDVGLSYLEDSLAKKSGLKPFDAVLEEIMKMKSENRLGIASFLILVSKGDVKRAAELAIKGHVQHGCTFCGSLLGFFTATGFFRGIGEDAMNSKIIRDFQLRFPITVASNHEALAALWFYREALEFGSMDPLALLASIYGSDEEELCEEFIDRMSELADASVENAVSAFSRPRRMAALVDYDNHILEAMQEREGKLLEIIASGELMVGPDEGEQSVFALQIPAMLEELKRRVPEAHHSRVFQALNKYLQDGKSTGSAIEGIRGLLDFMKRNAVVMVYNSGLQYKIFSCVTSLEVFRKLVNQHNRFARLLFAVSADAVHSGDLLRAFFAQLMLGEIFPPALLNAVTLANHLGVTPVPADLIFPEYLEVTDTHVSNCSGKELNLKRDNPLQSCESMCMRYSKCSFLLQPHAEAVDCRFFVSCPEAVIHVPATQRKASETGKSAGVSLLRKVREKNVNSVFHLRPGAQASLLERATARRHAATAEEALLRLSASAVADGNPAVAYMDLKYASEFSEEAKFQLAMMEFETFPGHEGSEELGLKRLYHLMFEETIDTRDDSHDILDSAFDEEWGEVFQTALGHDVLELLDVELPSVEPSSVARRLSAATVFIYRRVIRAIDVGGMSIIGCTSMALIITRFVLRNR